MTLNPHWIGNCRARQKDQLQVQLKKLDQEYDKCNDVLAKGELTGFKPEFPSIIISF